MDNKQNIKTDQTEVVEDLPEKPVLDMPNSELVTMDEAHSYLAKVIDFVENSSIKCGYYYLKTLLELTAIIQGAKDGENQLLDSIATKDEKSELLVILDEECSKESSDRALNTLPRCLSIKQSKIMNSTVGVFTDVTLSSQTCFGPFEGELVDNPNENGSSAKCVWQISSNEDKPIYLDSQNLSKSNWMRYIHCTNEEGSHNLQAFEHDGHIYYKTCGTIEPGSELIVQYEHEDFATINNVSNITSASLEVKQVEDDAVEDEEFSGNSENDSPAELKIYPESVEEASEFLIDLKSNDRSHYGQSSFDPVNKLHTCLHCNMQFKKLSLFRDHFRKHTGERPYKCDKCDSCFRLKKYLIQHNKGHSDSKPHVCSVCNAAFAYSTNLTRHVATHAEKKIKSFICSVCNKAFDDHTRLKYHFRTHTGFKPHQCEKCGKRFRVPAQLNLHLRTHSDKKPFVCAICGHACKQTNNFKRHMRTHDVVKTPIDKKHSCGQCDMRFEVPSLLRNHERKHTGEKPFSCGACGKCFRLNRLLKAHQVVHTEAKNHTCSTCGRAFSQPSNLHRHMFTHMAVKPPKKKDHECPICERRFETKSLLKYHLRTHTGEKPYQCPSCPKTFRLQKLLKVHEVTHTDVKKYVCTECGKAFRQASGLIRHMRIHSGEKPFQCLACSKRFNDATTLKRHVSTCKSR